MKVLIPFEYNILIGGAQMAIFEILESNKKNKIKNEFIFMLPSKGDLSDKLEEDNYTVYKCSENYCWEINKKSIIRSILMLLKITIEMRKIIIAEEIDLVYTNMAPSLFAAIINKLTLVRKIKIINHIRVSKISNKNIIFMRLFQNIIDRFITTNEKVKKRLIDEGINYKKVNRIYDSTNFTNENIDYNKVYDKEELNIAVIGRISEIKGQKEFIEIIKLIHRKYDESFMNTYIVGEAKSDKDKKYLNEILELIDKYKLKDKIRILPYEKNINKFLKDIDLVFCTTLYPGEGFGKIVIEAQSNYIPVIAFNYGSMPEIIEDGVNGYLVENIQQFSDRAIELLKNRKERILMGNSGFEIVHKKFNSEINNKIINDLFNE